MIYYESMFMNMKKETQLNSRVVDFIIDIYGDTSPHIGKARNGKLLIYD